MRELAALTRVRHLTHRGSVLACGFLVDAELVGVGEARRRIAALTGVDRVLALESRLLVTLLRPVRIEASRAPGLVLVESAGWITSLPLNVEAKQALGAAPAGGGLVVAVAGVAAVHALRDLEVVDPSDWVDLEAFEWLVAEPLRPKPVLEAPKVAPAAKEPNLLEQAGVAVSVRQMQELRAAREQALGGARTVREVLEAQGETEGAARERAAGAHRVSRRRAARVDGAGRRQSMARLFARLLMVFAQVLRPRPARADAPALPEPRNARGETRSNARSKAQGDPSTRPREPRAPSWLARLSQQLQRWASSLLLRSQLGNVLMRRQADFLRETMELLDRGDWDEALKRAIPLGGEAGGAPAPPSLGVPSLRRELSIQPWGGGATSAMNLATDLYSDFQRRYRRAFEALVERGEIEKAAFVLAELLRANEEAVSFLERHGRLELAAELAEARKLAPGLVVRQWLLAGDRQRAVRLAIRHAAFADAITRLEGDHRELALQLRALWADRLATAGDYAGAVDAAWGVAHLRTLVVRWAELGAQVGGVVAARMLLRRARAAPEQASRVFEELAVLSADLAPRAEDQSAYRVLRTLADEVLAGAESRATWGLAPEEARGYARLLAPRLLTGLGLRQDGVPSRRTAFRDLLELCDDPVLDFSISHAKGSGARSVGRRPLSISRSASDVGSLRIHDAVVLPSGKYLVALGELGLWMVTPRGRVEVRFSEPTERIVFSRHGDRAILLARRGEAWRLSRLDLVQRRIQPWRDAHIDVFASEFDGLTWLVGSNRHPQGKARPAGVLMAIDVSREWEGEVLAQGERAITGICAGAARARTAFGGPHQEVWEHELPSLTLRRRIPLPDLAPALHAGVTTSDEVCLVALSVEEGELGETRVRTVAFTPRDGVRSLTTSAMGLGRVMAASSRRVGVVIQDGAWLRGQVFDTDELREGAQRVEVALEARSGTPRGSMRLSDEHLLVFDDLGRLLHCDLERHALVGELRLRAAEFRSR